MELTDNHWYAITVLLGGFLVATYRVYRGRAKIRKLEVAEAAGCVAVAVVVLAGIVYAFLLLAIRTG